MEIDSNLKEEFIALCKPLIEWLQTNCHPHVRVIIEKDRAFMVEDILSTSFEEE
ncbi:MAG: hypothetical protein FWG89_08345 [Treponema sp.]|nr:hypothetical protein [Treponema sp.]